ncbi:unnamed protein product, partial [Heterosigma akashiwo]
RQYVLPPARRGGGACLRAAVRGVAAALLGLCLDRLSLFTSEYDELWMLSLETSYKKAADVLHD